MRVWGSRRRAGVPEVVEHLGLPPALTVPALCQLLVDRRARPLDLVPVPLAGTGLTGVWIALPAHDVICFERDTSPLHQRHIQLHELGHLALRHPPHLALPTAALERLVPHLDLQRLQGLLGRGACDSEGEREAEAFARVLGRRTTPGEAVITSAAAGRVAATFRGR